MGSLRIGIVGIGGIGRVHARSALRAGATLGGVVASTPERSVIAARDHGAERGFDSAAALIASDEIDVVHICTPNHLHSPVALAALDAGKHIVCEKPIALNLVEATEIVAAVRRSGRVATVPFAYRYYPTVREARVRARSSIGALRVLHGGYLQDWLLGADDDDWRVDAALGGPSRAFADIGSHWCDLVEFVTGERIVALVARTVVAHAERVSSKVGTEDVATVMFETEGGVIGTAVISQVAAGRKNHLWFEVSGSEESLYFDQERPETLRVGRRRGCESIPRDFDTLAPDAATYVTVPGGHPQGYQECFDAFVAETYAAISGGGAADGLPTIEDGLRAARLTDAVLKSATTRAWVEVG